MTGRKKRTGEKGDSSIPSSSSSHLSKKEKEDFQFQDVETGRNRARSKSREYYEPVTSRKVKVGEAKPERDLKLAEEMTRRDINGTVDLTAKEKELMILWNSFMFKEDKVASYCEDIGPLVLRFAQSFGKVIMDRDLCGEFLIHLINLQDFGQLKQSADIQRAVAIVKATSTNPTTVMEPETTTTNNENDAIATASSSTQAIPAASGYSDDATQMLMTIFSPRPRVSLGGTQGDLLADIAKYKEQVNACLVYFSEIRDIIEIKETTAQNAAKRQSEVNEVTPKDVPNLAERMSLLQVLDQTMEKLEKAWAQIKVLETRIRNPRPIMRSPGGQGQVGEVPPLREDSVRMDMAICCARTWLNSVVAGGGVDASPPSVPPVEIKSGPEFQEELQLEVPDITSSMAEVDLAEGHGQDLDLQQKPVNPGTVQVTQDSPSSSKPEKKDGAGGNLRRMDKIGLLAFMDGLESRDRDQKKSELEHGGVPAPAPIDKNLIAQDLALDDSEDSEDSDDDDDEDDEVDWGSDASPSPKKMKLSADANAARMNPSVEKERANYEATKTKGKGDGAPTKERVSVPIPSPAVESGARPSLLTGSSASKPTSAGGLGAASGSGFGARPGAFPSRRSFPFGNNDNDNKPKLHKTCDYCGKPFTNMEGFLKHQKKHASKRLELTVD